LSAEQNEKRSFFIFYAPTQPNLSKISASRAQNKSLLCVFPRCRLICLTFAGLSGSRSVASTTRLMGTIAFAKRPNNGRIKNNWRFSIANYQLFCTFACLFGEKPNFANKKIK